MVMRILVPGIVLLVYAVLIIASTYLSVSLLFNIRLEKVRRFLKSDWEKLSVVALAGLSANFLPKFYPGKDMTGTVLSWEGSTVAAFQSFVSDPLTGFLAIAYLIGFPVIVFTAYFKLRDRDKSLAHLLLLSTLYAIILVFPFWMFTPVKVPAYTLETVNPLLYDLSPLVGKTLFSLGNQARAFPSLHTATLVLVSIYSVRTERKHQILSLTTSAIILFSMFYLGVHWISDALAGTLIAFAVYYLSHSVQLQNRLKT